MHGKIQVRIQEHLQVVQDIARDPVILEQLEQQAEIVINTLQSGNRVFFCGNGGSAADAQHLAAELSGRFYLDRKALKSEALHVNSSFITAVGNDFGFDQVFARQLEAQAEQGDLVIGLSTSGHSENIIQCFKVANELGVQRIAWTGKKECPLDEWAELSLKIPSTDTPRIQEAHILIGHILCEIVESKLFGA